MSDWEKLEPLTEPAWNGCANCPPKPISLTMEHRLAVGFGIVSVWCDDERVWSGDNWLKKMRSVERAARRDPDHSWTVHFYGPLNEVRYQRHGRDEWHLVEKGDGFA